MSGRAADGSAVGSPAFGVGSLRVRFCREARQMKRRGSAHALFVSRPSLQYFLSCAATTSRPWTSPTSFIVTGFFSSAVIAARLGCENAPEITLGARVLSVSSVRGRAGPEKN